MICLSYVESELATRLLMITLSLGRAANDAPSSMVHKRPDLDGKHPTRRTKAQHEPPALPTAAAWINQPRRESPTSRASRQFSQ